MAPQITKEKLREIFGHPNGLRFFIYKDKGKGAYGFNIFIKPGQKTESTIQIRPVFSERKAALFAIKRLLIEAIKNNWEAATQDKDNFFLNEQIIKKIISELETKDEYQTFE